MSSTNGTWPAKRFTFDQKSVRARRSHSANFRKEISLPRAAFRRSLALSKAIMVVSSPGTKKPNFPNDIRWARALRKKADSASHGAFGALSRATPHAKQSHGHPPHPLRLPRQYLPLAHGRRRVPPRRRGGGANRPLRNRFGGSWRLA